MIKKKIIAIISLSLSLMLFGCGTTTKENKDTKKGTTTTSTSTITSEKEKNSTETVSSGNSKGEENISKETKTSEDNSNKTKNDANSEKNTENKSDDKESKTVSKELLQKTQDYFNKGENNGFLCSEYNNPKDISLIQLVYNGAGIDEKMTEEEKADYKDEIYTDITKVPKKALEELIKNKLNIELTSINGYEEFEKNFYSEKYDCYYLQHGDTNYQQVEFLSGEKNDDDDTYTFIYNGYSHTTFTQQEFKLKCYIDNDVYVIISNLPNN